MQTKFGGMVNYEENRRSLVNRIGLYSPYKEVAKASDTVTVSTYKQIKIGDLDLERRRMVK